MNKKNILITITLGAAVLLLSILIFGKDHLPVRTSGANSTPAVTTQEKLK